jgi:hypothetical protein
MSLVVRIRSQKTLAKLLVVLLFLAIGVTQAISQSPLHQHDHGDTHCCDLCHPGHIPVITSPGVGVVPVVGSTEWRQASPVAERVLSGSVSRASSCAPPQL